MESDPFTPEQVEAFERQRSFYEANTAVNIVLSILVFILAILGTLKHFHVT